MKPPVLQFFDSTELGLELKPYGKQAPIVAWTGEQALYWALEFSTRAQRQERMREQVNTGLAMLGLIIGVVGVVALGYQIFILPSKIVWSEVVVLRSPWLLLFWISAAVDSFLIYHFSDAYRQRQTIAKRPYKLNTSPWRNLQVDELATLKKDGWVDVSAVLSFEAREACIKAWELARKYHHPQVELIHLFIALLTYDTSAAIISRLGIPIETLKSKITSVVSKYERGAQAEPIVGQEFFAVVFQSYLQAWQLRLPSIGVTELLEQVVSHEGYIAELMYELEVDSDKITNVAAWFRVKEQLRNQWRQLRHRSGLRPKGTMNRAMTAIATPALDRYGRDLTQLAARGYLLPCVAREEEREIIFRIMHGGARRNVLLIGNPGVGRQTIIEGIAQSMVADAVPVFLQDKRLVSISIPQLVSGASGAEAHERLLRLLVQASRAGNVVLVFNNIHELVGITAGAQGGTDLSSVLAQVLKNSNLRCLATITPGDYQRYIEGKSQLEAVFEPVPIAEVTGNVAIQILEAKTGAIEYQQQVYFSYDSIAKAVEFSDRYLHDRYLPEKAIELLQEAAVMVRDHRGKDSVVAADDVARIISEKTNIPLTKITQNESEKLLNLEEQIHDRVIGQDEAVGLVATSLRRARAELRDMKRPIVTLLFLGPTGVGKTELAKTVAAVYFGAEENMIRLDMSEYQEKTSINRLIGAPPGYGSTEGGQLTEAMRKNPFSLVLLDELEKAHPDIINILLQVLEDGRLTDSSGRTVDFTNAIIIATSNAGTQVIQDQLKAGQDIEVVRRYLIENELQKYFRPELINRFDGVVVFKPLELPQVEQIAALMLNEVAGWLDKKGIGFETTPEAIAELARDGFDPIYGARPLRRLIQQRVQDAVAEQLIAGGIARRDIVVLGAGGTVQIKKHTPL